LLRLNRRVLDLMRLTHLTTVFEIHETLERALGSFGGAPAQPGCGAGPPTGASAPVCRQPFLERLRASGHIFFPLWPLTLAPGVGTVTSSVGEVAGLA
jgi:hypothetical protein